MCRIFSLIYFWTSLTASINLDTYSFCKVIKDQGDIKIKLPLLQTHSSNYPLLFPYFSFSLMDFAIYSNQTMFNLTKPIHQSLWSFPSNVICPLHSKSYYCHSALMIIILFIKPFTLYIKYRLEHHTFQLYFTLLFSLYFSNIFLILRNMRFLKCFYDKVINTR